jgi:hypothetical protein
MLIFSLGLATQELLEQIDEERQRRAYAERLLEEIQSERRAPFVVPALMEAFAMTTGVGWKARDDSDW